ncbi:MAG TPA: WbqC family protein [Salinivirgaceae bacterium]|nr:WbqC family protein [Salinivirgaceae bacterium]
MTNVVLSTAYFPNIQYFTKLVSNKIVFIEYHEHFLRQSFRTRSCIYGANGQQSLNVPVEKYSNNTKISEIKVAYHPAWQINHWRSIMSAYKNSPYFEHYADGIKQLFQKKYELLIEMNLEILNTLLKILKIGVDIRKTENYETSVDNDWRNGIHPKKQYAKRDDSFKPFRYYQVFAYKHGFIPNLSILDAIFCEGPATINIINKSIKAL